MPGDVLGILFGFAFTIAAAYSAGRILLARLRFDLYAEEAPLFAFITGSACLSMAVFVLAAIGQARPGLFLTLGILLIAFAIRQKQPHRLWLPPLPVALKWIFALIFIGYTVLYWSHAMGPEYSPDGSGYHLGLVARYLRQHGFGRITSSMYANLSQGLEMLFVFAFAFGRHSAAALVHFAFFLALVFGILAYARRFDFPRAGIFAAILVYASPVFGFDGTTAYNDVAAASVVFFVFYSIQIWVRTRQDSLLIVSGLLAGFAYGIKYTAGVSAVYALGFVLWKAPGIRRAAVICSGAAAMIAPWMIKNWIIVSNPVSPLMNRWFPNPYVSAGFEHDYVQQLIHPAGYGALERFLDTTYRAGPAASILGPAFLLAPLALFAIRSSAGRNLLLTAAVFGVCGINVQTRYLLPAIPFLALAIGLALIRIPFALPLIMMAQALLCWPSVLKSYSDSGLRVRHFLPKQALRIESEDSTLSYRLPGYRISRMVDRLVPPDGRILCFANAPQAYTSRELLVYYESTFNLTAIDILSIPSLPPFQPSWRFSFDIPPQPRRAVRIVQLGESSSDQWSVGEIHAFHGGYELIRSPQWSLNAIPNPFEIANAFDRNQVTRWRSHQPMYNGMRIEVDFGASEMFDRVTVDCSHDQPALRLRLEGRDSSGSWKTLSDFPDRFDVSSMPDFRRQAIQELKRRQITHLLITPPFPGAQDMETDPQSWGLRFLGEIDHTRLYALQ